MAHRLERQEKVDAYFQSRSSFWKDIYGGSGVLAEILRDRHAAVLDWIDGLALPPGSQVLEVGCGAGLMAVALAQRGLRVKAIDIVEPMVEQTRRHAEESGIANLLSADVGDAHALAFDNESFDVVLAIGVIPWLEQPELAMREIARVTKPGGYAILATANRKALPSLLDPLYNPYLAPLRQRVKHALERIGLWSRSSDRPLSMTYHDCGFVDAYLAGIGLIKTRGMTRGFEFWLLRHKILPEPFAIALHHRLQHICDLNLPGFRSLGIAYFVLTRKSLSRLSMQSKGLERSISDTKSTPN
jgi:2-polyprenyl-3-methyl-5-hydroxy-6-metoxy-1,4-benzoquinol methylase